MTLTIYPIIAFGAHGSIEHESQLVRVISALLWPGFVGSILAKMDEKS